MQGFEVNILNTNKMGVLAVASKANDGLILPAMLAAAYVTQNNPHAGIEVEYKELVSLGKGDEKVILAMDNGDVVVDGSVMPYFVNQKGTKKDEVCSPFLLSHLPKISHRLLGRRMATSFCGSCSS